MYKMFTPFHQRLMSESQVYASWHNHKAHTLVHWLVFLLMTFSFTGSMLTAINSVEGQDLPSQSTIQTVSFSHGKAQEPAQDHILLKFKSSTTESKRQDIYRRNSLSEKSEIKQIGVKVVNISPNDTPEEVVQRLITQDKAFLDFAEVDEQVSPSLIPNDPYYPNQWHLPKIQAPQAWDTSTGSNTVMIAILDTGVDCTHPDLIAHCVSGWNFYDNNSNTSDVYGHGTAVAGTAAAVGNNAIGIDGVAMSSLIMPIRISDLSGYGYSSTISNGIVYAADHGARVANNSYKMSLSQTITTAAQYLQSKGGVITISAGNDADFITNPDNPYVLTVSATGSNDALASWSTTGNHIDLSAPGVDIYVTTRGGGYGSWSGTSFSAPIVAGVAALVISVNPALTASQIQDVIKQSTDDLGTVGWDTQYGFGRVNAYKAVTLATVTTPPPPLPADTTAPITNITSPIDGQTVSGILSITASASDNIGVAKVELWRNGTLFGTDNNVPYTFSWNTSTDTNTTNILQTKAYDAAGNIGISSQVLVTVNNAPVLSITSYSVTQKTANTATITWATNIPSSGTVDYGTSATNLTNSALDSVYNTTHAVTLTNLIPSTKYYYKITTTASGVPNTATTPISTFRTNRK